MARSSSRRMKQGIKTFFEQGKALDANPDTRAESLCWLCGMRIDYDVDPNSTPESHNLDHYYPVSTHPELAEDPANWRHSHALCNNERGNRTPDYELNEQIPDWW